MGAFMIWFVAAGLCAAVPAGIGQSVHALLASRFAFTGPADRAARFAMGAALAASAVAIIHEVGPAFCAVMLAR